MTEQMKDELNYLCQNRPCLGLTDEEMQTKFPEYFARVVKLIRKMGAVTELNGHSQDLDGWKNEAYKLIGL